MGILHCRKQDGFIYMYLDKSEGVYRNKSSRGQTMHFFNTLRSSVSDFKSFIALSSRERATPPLYTPLESI